MHLRSCRYVIPYDECQHIANVTPKQAEKAFRRDLVQTQIGDLPTNRIIDLENDNPGIVRDNTSRRTRRPPPVIIIDSPPRMDNTRKRPADSQLQRQKGPNIKQEPIDVEALGDTRSEVLPAPTIKNDSSRGSTRNAKRVKFEQVEEDDPVDLSQFEEFKQQEPNAVEEEDRLAEQLLIDQEQTVEREVDHAELEPVVEDELSEEERRAAAEEKAKNDEELEEAARQWAEMMKKAAQAEQSAM